MSNLGAKIRVAKKSKKEKDVRDAVSMVDKAAKKHIIHKNKASRIKSSLQNMLPKSAKSPKKASPKSKKKAAK